MFTAEILKFNFLLTYHTKAGVKVWPQKEKTRGTEGGRMGRKRSNGLKTRKRLQAKRTENTGTSPSASSGCPGSRGFQLSNLSDTSKAALGGRKDKVGGRTAAALQKHSASTSGQRPGGSPRHGWVLD